MIDVKIDVSDALARLGSIADATLAQQIADKVADAVIAEGAKYPPQAHRRQPFKSNRQRAFVMGGIKRGTLSIPYRRTGALGASGSKQPFGGGANVVWTAGHAEMVIGERQSAYFNNWPNVTKIAQKIESDTAEAIATAAVVEALQKAGLA